MKHAVGLIVFLGLVAAFPTWADPVPPGVYECASKIQEGDPCTIDGVAGTCWSTTCSRYKDGQVEGYSCLRCMPSPTTATSTNTATGSTATSTATGSDGAPPAQDDGACSVAKRIGPKEVAPWLLAASFSLLFFFGRRRRR
jgi:hypothetical protein